MTARPGPRWRRALLAVLGLAAAALAGDVLYDSSDELLTAADTLSHLTWSWVAVALVAETASYLFRGGAQATVLRAGAIGTAGAGDPERPRLPGPGVLGATTLAGDSAAYCLPFGFAASGAVMLGVLRRRGVDAALTGWMFAVSTLLYVGAVCLLTVLAVQIAGDSDPVPGLQLIGFGVLAGLALFALVYATLRHVRTGRGRPPAPRRVPQGRLGALVATLRRRLGELRAIRLPPHSGVAAFALMLLSWAGDISVLGFAYEAVHSTPPWAGLLLAYCAGQIAAAFPATPGGIGVVEGSLTLALVAFGGAQTITLAAVLLYRIITYWACIPLGALAWLGLRATGRPPVAAVLPPLTGAR